MSNFKKIGFLTLVACCLSLVAVQTARAQDGLGIGIQPAITEETLDLGESFSFTMRVTNHSDEEKEYFLEARDIRELSAGGQPIFVERGQNIDHGLSSWISFPQLSIIVGPNETGRAEININVPFDASPGGHFAAVFISLEPPEVEGTATKVGTNVGTLMNFRIAGDIIEEMQIREFTTDKAVYTNSQVELTVKVENLGNVLLRPVGPLEITNIFGKKVATFTINETGRGVFPGQVRDFNIEWDGGKFAFGRYQALAGLVYGEDSRKSIDTTISFWVLPMNIIAPVVGGLILIIGGAIIFMKWMVNRKLKMLEQVAGSLPKAKKQATVDAKLSVGSAAPISKLAMIALALLFLSLIFLIILFFFFG